MLISWLGYDDLICVVMTDILVCCCALQDATANDIANDSFDVKGYPTIYFKSASGNILPYEGDRSKEDIIEFIQKNRDKADGEEEETKDEL